MKLYTIKEITESFGVSRQTVSNWRKKGLIKEIKIDRTVRFSEEEILKIKRGE